MSDTNPPQTFRNPLKMNGADPWLFWHEGFYYLVTTTGTHIEMRKAAHIGDLATAPDIEIWRDKTKARSRQIWASEFYLLDAPDGSGKRWYAYYTASDGVDVNHRMHILESESADPLGPYHYKATMRTDAGDEYYAIDGSLIEKPDGTRYFVWAGHPKHVLYISQLENPWTTVNERVSLPASGFGCREVREGPVALRRNGRIFLVYSACDTGKPDYKLGMLIADENADSMNPKSWKQHRTPVFERNDAAKVYGPGHNSFFKSPDGTEDWICYHAKSTSRYTYRNRSTRVQRFTWNPDGTPNFGVPLSLDTDIAVPSGEAQKGNIKDVLNAYIEAQRTARQIPGISVAVIQRGESVLVQGYGLANIELSVPATPDTVYQLASVTKQFTATAIMRLVEEGSVALEAPVSQYLSDLPSLWQTVTIQQLLNHTSGIKSYTNLPNFRATLCKDYKQRELLALVADVPLEFAPGEQFEYNNTGYFLLGMVIEAVSGEEYGAFLDKHFFAPLDMAHTRLNDLAAIIPNRADGYSKEEDTLRNGEYVSPTQPFAAGALISTVRDLIKWNAALDAGHLLTPESWKQIWTPAVLNDETLSNYGFGWSLEPLGTVRRIHHSGGIPGFSTHVSRFPDEHLTIIVLANADFADADALAQGIAAHFLPDITPSLPPQPALSP